MAAPELTRAERAKAYAHVQQRLRRSAAHKPTMSERFHALCNHPIGWLWGLPVGDLLGGVLVVIVPLSALYITAAIYQAVMY